MKKQFWVAAVLVGASFAPAQTVDVESLLNEMVDLERLAQRPDPYYKSAQASSYDLRSVSPEFGGEDGWFANADAGNYRYAEEVDGQMQYVLAELEGPGAVVRLWSANPQGTLHFYFDGETEPRLSAPTAEVLSGEALGLADPFGYVAAMGHNLYFPLPYAESLKIAVTGGPDEGLGDPTSMYYHVGYREYEAGTDVKTFEPEAIPRSLVQEVSEKLLNPDTALPDGLVREEYPLGLPSQSVQQVDLQGEGQAVYRLSLKLRMPPLPEGAEWDHPRQPHNVLRSVYLAIYEGEENVVWTPLGDFFGSAPAINAYQTLPMEVQPDGTMVSRFVMPYRESMRIIFQNASPVGLSGLLKVDTGPFTFDEDTYTFRSQWQAFRGMSRPFRDFTYANLEGEGQWVGSHLHIANSTQAWWGEGDEKVFVDNEEFPSYFGTGTEDYYGYAWCSPEVFQKPYHAQPRCDGPANFGHTSLNRFHIIDPIPYREALKFDMEIWHWQDVFSSWAATSYWYGRPGATSPVEINRRLLLPTQVRLPRPPEGGVEAENLERSEPASGNISVQGGFPELSGVGQVWWTDPEVGDQLSITLPVEEPGTYELTGNFCFAPDYGIHRIYVNGELALEQDFYDVITWKRLSLGTYDLSEEAVITIEVVGQNPEAIDRRMFGLDWLKLEESE
jgi:hypothetical protein